MENENKKNKKHIDKGFVFFLFAWCICIVMCILSFCFKSHKTEKKETLQAKSSINLALQYDSSSDSLYDTDNMGELPFTTRVINRGGVLINGGYQNKYTLYGSCTSGSINYLISTSKHLPTTTNGSHTLYFYNFGSIDSSIQLYTGQSTNRVFSVPANSKIEIDTLTYLTYRLRVTTTTGVNYHYDSDFVQFEFSENPNLTSYTPYGSFYSEDAIITARDTSYSEGYSVGYDEGLEIAENATFDNLIGSIVDEPFAILYNLLNFEILGVNLWVVISTILSLAVVVFVVKRLKS